MLPKAAKKQINTWINSDPNMPAKVKQELRQALKDNPDWIMRKFKIAIDRYNRQHNQVNPVAQGIKNAT